MHDWTKDLYTLRHHWKWVCLLAVVMGGVLFLSSSR